MEIKYLVVPEVDPKKVSFSYQLFLDDFVRVCVTSDFRVWGLDIHNLRAISTFAPVSCPVLQKIKKIKLVQLSTGK